MEKWYEEQWEKRIQDADKALFDFDESINNLEEIEDRYQQVTSSDAVAGATVGI